MGVEVRVEMVSFLGGCGRWGCEKNSGSGFWLSRNFYVGLLPFLNIGFGDDLSFREATLRVLLAMKVFTTVFGMGTGGVLSLCHRKTFVVS